jgi:hypothetical protein
MASPALSRRVGKVVRYAPLVDMVDRQWREFHEALLEADSFEDLPGKCRRRSSRPSRTDRTSARGLVAAAVAIRRPSG